MLIRSSTIYYQQSGTEMDIVFVKKQFEMDKKQKLLIAVQLSYLFIPTQKRSTFHIKMRSKPKFGKRERFLVRLAF